MRPPSSRLRPVRAALYARYSSDRQNERSIEDQLAVCRRHAEARGWEVVATFSDAAISGAAMANRPGLQTLLAAASGAAFDLVLVEDEDRLARDLEHQAHIYNRLKAQGVAIATLSSERIGILEVGLKGVMAELYLANLSQKTARGMRANAEAGRATGARVYGYRSQPGGEVAIVEAEAEVVREIFERFAAGEAPRAIAADLNRRGVPSTYRRGWSGNMVTGDRKRGNGILANELYAGVKAWNRDTVVKDRETGKRRHVYRPPAEWRRTPVPHLRIVSEEAWAAVQARKGAERAWTPGQLSARRKGLLSGLVKCGRCGASYTSFSKTRLTCAARREKGACDNAAMPRRAMVERRVLEGLRTRLATPEAAAAYVRAYHAAWAELAAERRRDRAPVDRRLAELGRRIDRLVDDVCEGRITPAGREKLIAHEAEKAQLEVQLAAWDAEAAAPPVTLHPAAPGRYAQLIAELAATLAEAAADLPRARPLIDQVRGLILRIDVAPDPAAEDGFAINVVGDLSRFLEPADKVVGYAMVAGARYGRGPNSLPAPFAA